MIIRGGSPTAQPAKPTEDSPDLDEQQSLVAWEFLCLLDLGFTIEQTQQLVRVPQLSWHDADRLLKRGWPHPTVVDELT